MKNEKRFSMSNIRFLVLMFLVHAAYFICALYFKKIYNGDSHEYIYMALNIKDHGWFYAGNPALPIDPEYYTLRTPVYPLFLALLYTLGLGNWGVLVVQGIISICNILILRDTLRYIKFTRSYDWLLSAFVLLYPSQFINTNTIAPDLLLQTCVLFYFRSFILYVKQKK